MFNNEDKRNWESGPKGAGARNFKRDNDFCNFPLYAISLFPGLTARSS
jgi:hypothetical protein